MSLTLLFKKTRMADIRVYALKGAILVSAVEGKDDPIVRLSI